MVSLYKLVLLYSRLCTEVQSRSSLRSMQHTMIMLQVLHVCAAVLVRADNVVSVCSGVLSCNAEYTA